MKVGLSDFVRESEKFPKETKVSAFKCGHPKTEENTRSFMTKRGYLNTRCAICHKEANRHWLFKKKMGIL